MVGSCLGVVSVHVGFDGTAERGKPGREPVDGDALQAAAKDFGKGRLVDAASCRAAAL